MTTLRLQSGVCISSNNPSILQQYLKQGAVEIKDEVKEEVKQEVKEEKTPVKRKTTKSKE